eukprot:g1014.t1
MNCSKNILRKGKQFQNPIQKNLSELIDGWMNFFSQLALTIGAAGGAAFIVARVSFSNFRAANKLSQTARDAALVESITSKVFSHVSSVESRVTSRLHKQELSLGQNISSHVSILGDRLASVDAATKNIGLLTENVSDIGAVLSGSQARGAFGEFQLEELVKDLLPPGSYEFQSSLRKGTVRVDCLIRLPTGSIAIDSKFPLDAFRELLSAKYGGKRRQEYGDRQGEEKVKKKDYEVDSDILVRTKTTTATLCNSKRTISLSPPDTSAVASARSRLGKHLKGHIKTIADKYIVPGETSEQALLFLPSEAVYSEVHANLPKVVDYAHQRKVWIVSPTTMMAVLTTMRGVMKDSIVKERSSFVLEELNVILNDVERLRK